MPTPFKADLFEFAVGLLLFYLVLSSDKKSKIYELEPLILKLRLRPIINTYVGEKWLFIQHFQKILLVSVQCVMSRNSNHKKTRKFVKVGFALV